MGVCPALSPQQRTTKAYNKQLLQLLQEKLKDLQAYQFAKVMINELSDIQNRYLYNEGIIEDIQNILHIVEHNKSFKTESLAIETIEQQLRNSCLIIEDEMYKQKNPPQPNTQPRAPSSDSFHLNHKLSPESETQIIKTMPESTEYQKNLAENQSLVCQINIIYQRDLDLTKYHNSLKLFLKWSTIFHEHFYGGFLKTIYKIFCTSLYKTDINELETIVDETSVFVQFMVGVYTEIYGLRTINASQNGALFKNENVFNLIMANIFKKTKIKKFARRVIVNREGNKIQRFKSKLEKLLNKDMDFFGVQQKFQLRPAQQLSNLNQSTEYLSEKPMQSQTLLALKQPSPAYFGSTPYSSALPLIYQLCENSETPITKLKLIVQISKLITAEIYKYYDGIQKQVPQIDPDNLTCIIMYLVVKANRFELYEELKIAELFTTGNCLTCISGYYLNVFNAAIESLLELGENGK